MLEDNPLDKKRPNPTSFPFVVDGGIIRSLRSFSNEVGAQPLGLFLCQHSLAIHDSFLGNGMRAEESRGFRFGKSLDLPLLSAVWSAHIRSANLLIVRRSVVVFESLRASRRIRVGWKSRG